MPNPRTVFEEALLASICRDCIAVIPFIPTPNILKEVTREQGERKKEQASQERTSEGEPDRAEEFDDIKCR